MTKFKDVAHLYLGCKVKSEYGAIMDMDAETLYDELIAIRDYNKSQFDTGTLKPILRKLSDMALEERNEIFEGCHEEYWPEWTDQEFDGFNLVGMLKYGFDLFGLIESGQAIDASTLK